MDRLVAGLLVPLAMWVLASGLDDLLQDLLYYWRRLRRRGGVDKEARPEPAAEKRIALMIPAWREEAVIEQMLDHNLAAIRYSHYEVFVGAYPNDLPTLSRLRAAEQKHARVHVVVCPQDGPTSKADCLNWVYQGILLYEESHGGRFDVVLHHDAEDLIHARSLEWINRCTEQYDMVQVPVLPLATGWREFTHGVYCDEFAQTHGRELHVRVWRGGFLPSCGVGTAYRREMVDRLAWNHDGRLFDPELLTEDYIMGMEVHRLGGSQILLDPAEMADERGPGATREYFPRGFPSAVRQRGRWLAGIVLQGWERIGWRTGPKQWYWLWRDRKGLVGNPLTALANLTFLYGAAGWMWSRWTGGTWELGELVRNMPVLPWVLAVNTALILWRQAVRTTSTARFYGWRLGSLAPVRSVWGNVINLAATLRAVRLYLVARMRQEELPWLKTDHLYPAAAALRKHKRRLGEVLVEAGLAAPETIARALEARQSGERIGDYLVRAGTLSEVDLYRALGVQHALPFELLSAGSLEPDALERLPREVAERWTVLPVRVAHERYLWIASPELPGDEAEAAIREASGLEPRFQLLTPGNFAELWAAVNWPVRKASGSRPSSRHPRG